MSVRFETPSSFSARDEFDQTAGALTGKTAPIGGVWVGAGDADDFAVETTGKTARRTAVSDSSLAGRFAIAGVAAATIQGVRIDCQLSTVPYATARSAAVARYIDTSNYLFAYVNALSGTPRLEVWKVIAGAPVVLANTFIAAPGVVTFSIQLQVDAAGRWAAWLFAPGAPAASPLLQGQDSALATGGSLASGKPGFYDEWDSTGAATRTYDNFLAFVPTPDAACFASQSLVYSHEGAFRENAAGTQWAEKTVSGRNLFIPCSGAEGRTPRVFVMASRHDPDTMAHEYGGLRATLTITERYLGVPGS